MDELSPSINAFSRPSADFSDPSDPKPTVDSTQFIGVRFAVCLRHKQIPENVK